jgi:hypothetical protein
METWAIVPEARTRTLRMNRVVRRVRRGVGIKGMGRIKAVRVMRVERVRVTLL